MKILADTNVFIAAYPAPRGQFDAKVDVANELVRLAQEHNHVVYLHKAAVASDFGNIQDIDFRAWRLRIARNLPALPEPPAIQASIIAACGEPQSANERVDYSLLAAVVGNAVDVLVTEDKGIHHWARALGLGERVVYIEDAMAAIKANIPGMSLQTLLPDMTVAHSLDENDPIFDSLREDYDGFDSWLEKCKREHRTCWVVKQDGCLAGLTVVKEEYPAEYGPGGKTLKVCLFKVAEGHWGNRYAELLLKPVFDYAFNNAYEAAYLTVFPKYKHLVDFMGRFGFTHDGGRKGDELVLVKRLKPDERADAGLGRLDFHIKYGPRHYADGPRLIVPILPGYCDVLFPEAGIQKPMPNGSMQLPAGNGIQKAYLSRGNIRSLGEGDILYFYRSKDVRGLVAVGIVEGIMVSASGSEISRYVGKRTVYSASAISELTKAGQKEVVAVLFRQARALVSGPKYRDLKIAGVCSGRPQSIMEVSDEGSQWLKNNVDRRMG